MKNAAVPQNNTPSSKIGNLAMMIVRPLVERLVDFTQAAPYMPTYIIVNKRGAPMAMAWLRRCLCVALEMLEI
jgi:hypothetical protein